MAVANTMRTYPTTEHCMGGVTHFEDAPLGQRNDLLALLRDGLLAAGEVDDVGEDAVLVEAHGEVWCDG